MSEFHLHNWVDVNAYMREDYRLLVAAMAARQVPSAVPELQTLARNAFNSIPVPGARSFSKADLVQQRKALAKAMPGSSEITSLVIALWAIAADSYMTLLKQAGTMAGLEFNQEWTWQKGIEGFYAFEDIAVLSALADGLGEKMQEKDYDHLKLAALWLGPAVTNPEALSSPDVHEHEHDHDDEHEHEEVVSQAAEAPKEVNAG